MIDFLLTPNIMASFPVRNVSMPLRMAGYLVT